MNLGKLAGFADRLNQAINMEHASEEGTSIASKKTLKPLMTIYSMGSKHNLAMKMRKYNAQI
ncbi:hypothetical protein AZI98_13165 [Aeribacillus pallidus]|uniref:Uncharacterized protein n=1 Tax=Aeribacillus pallidus TaxID=33936 RepID=A0A165X3M1_9BACI|nr:hypothetical protein AZI98_13165 [Aeribacillus pallidus]